MCGILFTDLSDYLLVFVTVGNLQKLKLPNDNQHKFRLIDDKTINQSYGSRLGI